MPKLVYSAGNGMRNGTTSLLYESICKFFLCSPLMTVLMELQASQGSSGYLHMAEAQSEGCTGNAMTFQGLRIIIKLHKHTKYCRVDTTFLPCFHGTFGTKGTQFMHRTCFSSLKNNLLSVHHRLNDCMTWILTQPLLMWLNVPAQTLPENHFLKNFLFKKKIISPHQHSQGLGSFKSKQITCIFVSQVKNLFQTLPADVIKMFLFSTKVCFVNTLLVSEHHSCNSTASRNHFYL